MVANRKTLNRTPQMATNIFIPHIHEDDAQIEAMKSLLRERGFDVHVVDRQQQSEQSHQHLLYPQQDPRPGNRLGRCGRRPNLAQTRNSEHVEWEIRYAQEQGKRIVGVYTHGSAECDMPDALQDYAKAIVGWNSDRIVGAICGTINDVGERLAAAGSRHADSAHPLPDRLRLYSYVVARDFGFAPNPFHGFCTLATCKPEIRRTAHVGDWIVGTGSKPNDLEGRLVYAMRSSEAISFDEFWKTSAFVKSARTSMAAACRPTATTSTAARRAGGGCKRTRTTVWTTAVRIRTT